MAQVRPKTGSVVQRNGAWHLRYRPSQGAREKSVRLASLKETNRTEAVRLADAHIDATGWSRGASTTPRPSPSTRIIDYVDNEFMQWSKNNHRPSTHYGIECLIRQKLRAHLGDRRFCDYRTYDASLFLSEEAKRLNERSVSKLRSLLSLIFKWAKTEGYIATNPMRDLMLKTTPRPVKKTRAYSAEQMRQIVSILKGREQAFMLLLCLGLRPSEVVGLMWSDIDFENGQIHVVRTGWRGQTFDSGKTGEERVVTLGPGAAAILRAYRENSVSVKGYVVESYRGNQIDPDDIYDLVKPILLARGLPWLTFYACRRGAATQRQNLANGNSLHVAQELGHSITTANSYYLKPISELERANAMAYDALLLTDGTERDNTTVSVDKIEA